MKRVNYKKEPVAKMSRWKVKCGGLVFHFITRKEAMLFIKAKSKKEECQLFKATYNFIEAWK